MVPPSRSTSVDLHASPGQCIPPEEPRLAFGLVLQGPCACLPPLPTLYQVSGNMSVCSPSCAQVAAQTVHPRPGSGCLVRSVVYLRKAAGLEIRFLQRKEAGRGGALWFDRGSYDVAGCAWACVPATRPHRVREVLVMAHFGQTRMRTAAGMMLAGHKGAWIDQRGRDACTCAGRTARGARTVGERGGAARSNVRRCKRNGPVRGREICMVVMS
ncbi:hypothetical protein IQ07DRAFT_653184 [Pyrenochaeta sp. DS3sAY3a]|nr:hypothetical protein IQ07DRAFT_653184 [Pyrenochaeta sp. DS3sAY3a]